MQVRHVVLECARNGEVHKTLASDVESQLSYEKYFTKFQI